MASGPDPGEPSADDLAAELDAERAAVDHWRRVAQQRTAEYAELRHRPVVRAVLAADRRTAPARARTAVGLRRLRTAGARAALTASGVRHRLFDRGSPNTGLRADPAGEATLTRSLVLLVVGSPAPGLGAVPPWPVGVTVVSAPTGAVAEAVLRQAIAAVRPDLVGIVLATSAPRDAALLARLAAAVEAGVVAATALVIHPRRPLSSSTPHDGLVREAGLALDLDAAGVPTVSSVAAGAHPGDLTEPAPVDAASAAAIVIDAAAFEAAGGLGASVDVDTAVVELCARLRAGGGIVVVVPSAVVVDHRPARSRRDLGSPIHPTSLAWSRAIDRSGALLRRVARPERSPERIQFALTIAAPSAKVADRWGDCHLASALAESLRRRGHGVRLQTADHANDLAGRACDVHVVLRGLQPVRRTPGQRHVVWVISHPESIDDDELDAADLVLVASARFAEHLRTRTSTPVETLLQATDHRRFRPVAPDPAHRHDVTIVAKTRDVLRSVVADALEAGLQPRIYGGGWRGLVSPELIVTDHIDNSRLPTVYASAGVVLNDHWRTMRAWGFVSNRLFDVLACGTPVISDPVPGIAQLFDGAVSEYRDPEHLRGPRRAGVGGPRRSAA